MNKFLFGAVIAAFVIGCKSPQYAPARYHSEFIQPQLSTSNQESHPLNQWLKPYQKQLSAALDSQLFVSCRTATKMQPQSALGSHLTLVMREFAQAESQSKIDGAMLNYGGIRASMPQGAVRIRHIFEIMPFDNALCVVEMDSLQMIAFADYWIKTKGHPISGFQVILDAQKRAGIVWDNAETHYPVKMAVTDYVANGGDNATFFKQISTRKCLKTPLREALIQYYRKHFHANDTLCLPKEE